MEQVLVAPAIIDIGNKEKTVWQATGCVEPFIGIFGTGASFKEAREAFAELVAIGVKNGGIEVEGYAPGEIQAIRVLATTRKTFNLDDLETGPEA